MSSSSVGEQRAAVDDIEKLTTPRHQQQHHQPTHYQQHHHQQQQFSFPPLPIHPNAVSYAAAVGTMPTMTMTNHNNTMIGCFPSSIPPADHHAAGSIMSSYHPYTIIPLQPASSSSVGNGYNLGGSSSSARHTTPFSSSSLGEVQQSTQPQSREVCDYRNRLSNTAMAAAAAAQRASIYQEHLNMREEYVRQCSAAAAAAAHQHQQHWSNSCIDSSGSGGTTISLPLPHSYSLLPLYLPFYDQAMIESSTHLDSNHYNYRPTMYGGTHPLTASSSTMSSSAAARMTEQMTTTTARLATEERATVTATGGAALDDCMTLYHQRHHYQHQHQQQLNHYHHRQQQQQHVALVRQPPPINLSTIVRAPPPYSAYPIPYSCYNYLYGTPYYLTTTALLLPPPPPPPPYVLSYLTLDRMNVQQQQQSTIDNSTHSSSSSSATSSSDEDDDDAMLPLEEEAVDEATTTTTTPTPTNVDNAIVDGSDGYATPPPLPLLQDPLLLQELSHIGGGRLRNNNRVEELFLLSNDNSTTASIVARQREGDDLVEPSTIATTNSTLTELMSNVQQPTIATENNKDIMKENNMTTTATTTTTALVGKKIEVEPTTATACCICLEIPSYVEICSIKVCIHNFCFGCIERWADLENTCPLCKKRFHTIERLHTLKSMSSRKRKSNPTSSSCGGEEGCADGGGDSDRWSGAVYTEQQRGQSSEQCSHSRKRVRNRDQRSHGLNFGGAGGLLESPWPTNIAQLLFSGLGASSLNFGGGDRYHPSARYVPTSARGGVSTTTTAETFAVAAASTAAESVRRRQQQQQQQHHLHQTTTASQNTIRRPYYARAAASCQAARDSRSRSSHQPPLNGAALIDPLLPTPPSNHPTYPLWRSSTLHSSTSNRRADTRVADGGYTTLPFPPQTHDSFLSLAPAEQQPMNYSTTASSASMSASLGAQVGFDAGRSLTSGPNPFYAFRFHSSSAATPSIFDVDATTTTGRSARRRNNRQLIVMTQRGSVPGQALETALEIDDVVDVINVNV